MKISRIFPITIKSLSLEGKVATQLTDEVSVLRDCLNWRYCNSAPHPPHFIRHLLPREKALFKKFNALLRRGEHSSPLRFGAFDFGKLPCYFTQKKETLHESPLFMRLILLCEEC